MKEIYLRVKVPDNYVLSDNILLRRVSHNFKDKPEIYVEAIEIQLPSEEEIDKQAIFHDNYVRTNSFRAGYYWLLNKLKGE